MVKALQQHLVLLMTMRHPGKGLPTQWVWLWILAIPYLAAGVLRHAEAYGPVQALAALAVLPIVLLSMTSQIGLVCGWMMISIFIDSMAVAFPAVPKGIWSLWGLGATLALGVRMIHTQNGRSG